MSILLPIDAEMIPKSVSIINKVVEYCLAIEKVTKKKNEEREENWRRRELKEKKKDLKKRKGKERRSANEPQEAP